MENRSVEVIVPGNPAPQDRARVRAFINPRTGKPQATVYSRKGPTKDYKARISLAASQVISDNSRLEGPLSMIIALDVEKPKSKPKKKSWPDVKPDLDNYVKAVKDALKGIAYRDDSQICMLTAFKRYAIFGNPQTYIKVYEIMEEWPHVSNQESAGQISTNVPGPKGDK